MTAAIEVLSNEVYAVTMTNIVVEIKIMRKPSTVDENAFETCAGHYFVFNFQVISL